MVKKKKHQLTNDHLIKLVAQIAHSNGVSATVLPNFPRLYKDEKLKPEQITPTVAAAADRYNHQKLREMVDKLNETSPAVLLPPGESLRAVHDLCAKTVGYQIGLIPFLRWAGSQGWTELQARTALHAIGLEVQTWLISQQMEYGAQGHGIPPLTDEQESGFWELLGKI